MASSALPDTASRAAATVHRIGFTQLSSRNPPLDGSREVNIIFVHGLRGHPQKTWEATSNSDRAASPGRRKVFWPRDYLVEDLPEANVWTYGYNADVIGGLFQADNQNSVSQHGRDLAVKIERDLEKEGFRGPIIFVAHSLGGIVVKDAIRRSDVCRVRTKLVVFLGTPHRGSSSAGWGTIASNLASLALQDTSKRIIKTLEVNSEVLDNIHDEFQGIVLDKRIHIHSFQEARDISGIKGPHGKVIDDFSSKLGLPSPFETVESMDTNHIQMARCSMKTEPPYSVLSQVTNNRFAGRGAVLDQLQGKFIVSRKCRKVAVIGLGGVGKTQVALQLAYWVKDNQPDYSIFWVPAQSVGSFEQAYTEMAKQLAIRGEKGKDIKELVQRYLDSETTRKWLLIVDNADDYDLLFGSSNTRGGLNRYLPNNDNALVLFTTRSRDVAIAAAGSDVIYLHEMSLEEATDFLEKTLIQKRLLQNESITKEFLQQLTYLPLAISQAAAYINRNQVSIERYLGLLRGTEQAMIGLLSREFHDDTRYPGSQNAIATTWLVSFEHISNLDETAADLLLFLSYIEPKAIPQSLFPSPQSEETEHAIGTLCGYAFLVRGGADNIFDIHSLVHLAMRMWISKHNRTKEVVEKALDHVAKVFPWDEPANREQWREYMPHALRLLEGTREYQRQERYDLYRRFKEAAKVLEETCIYRLAGRTKEAIEILEHIVAVKNETLAEHDPSRLASQSLLASAYLNDRRTKEAIKISEHVTAIQEKTLTDEAYLDSDRIKEAIEILEHAVAEDGHDRFGSKSALARAYLKDERVTEAIELLERVVAIKRKTLAEDSHDRLVSEHELACAYLDDGRINEAIGIFEHVVTAQTQTLARSKDTLAGILKW
ncbi:hypothetical protein GGR52DRAFT_579405 [Hypoxylon sp. FL1284]|nr:hypothetical protein GGR52DRAFT_579405 [Hypoxylon sp. FL1284]